MRAYDFIVGLVHGYCWTQVGQVFNGFGIVSGLSFNTLYQGLGKDKLSKDVQLSNQPPLPETTIRDAPI